MGEKKGRKRRRHPDIEMASIAVKGGFISESAAKSALKEVKKRAKVGKDRVSFLRMLLMQKVIDTKQLPKLAQEIERHTYICDNCERRCVLAPSKNRVFSCPRCGSGIEANTTEHSHYFDASREEASEPPGLSRMLRHKRVVFGRYKLLEELGRGAMGVVYKARHVELKKDVALKVLLAGVGARKSHVTRFRREAAAVARLNHPNIVRVSDFGVDNDMHFLAMDLVEGGESFHSTLRNNQDLSLEERLSIVRKVAIAIQHAHDQNIVHRDLKPANILITPEGEPMVADFGLAKDFEDDDELTQPEARVGTPLFLAPELIHKGAGAVDNRADVWSLGVMVFLSVTGRYPYRSKTVMELYVQVLQEEPDWEGRRIRKLTASQDVQTTKRLRQPFKPGSKEFPPDLRLICQKALMKTPELRYQSAQELADDLGRFLRGARVKVRPPSIFESLRFFFKRNRSMAVIIPTALLLVLLISSLFYFRTRLDKERLENIHTKIQSAWKRTRSGALAYKRNGYKECQDELSRLLKKQPSNSQALTYRGLCRMHMFDDEGAEQDLFAALKGADEASKARIGNALAMLKLFQDRVDEGLGFTETSAAKIDAGVERERLTIRGLLLLARRHTKAFEKAQKELGSSKLGRHKVILGTMAWLSTDFDKAQSLFEEVVKASPTDSEAVVGLNVTKIRKGVTGNERGQTTKVLEKHNASTFFNGLDPLASYYFNEGVVFNKAQKHTQAVAALQRANKLCYWFADARGQLGAALERLERIDEAVRAFAAAVRFNPRHDDYEKQRNYLLDRACDQASLEFAAKVHVEEGRWRSERSYRHFQDLGIAYMSLGQPKKCLETMEQAHSIAKRYVPRITFYRYMAGKELGEVDKKVEEKWLWLSKKDRWDDMREVARSHYLMCRTFLIRGLIDECREQLKKTLEKVELYNNKISGRRRALEYTPRALAVRAALMAYESQDNQDQVFSMLEQAVRDRGITTYELDRLAAFRFLRKHPRFIKIRQLSIEQRWSKKKQD